MIKNIYPIIFLSLLACGCFSSIGKADCCDSWVDCWVGDAKNAGPLEGRHPFAIAYGVCCKPIHQERIAALCAQKYPADCWIGYCEGKTRKGRECGGNNLLLNTPCQDSEIN